MQEKLIEELYDFRMVYNAALFNEWAEQKSFDGGINYHNDKTKFDVHKSWKYSDGEFCFGGSCFIVMADLPTGQISNHYKWKYWDLFKIPEKEKANIWDGHTSEDVINRLKQFLQINNK